MGQWRRIGRTTAIWTAAAVLGSATVASADGTRLTFTFQPSAPITSSTLEVVNTGRRSAVPSLKLAGDGAPVRLTGWSLPLPGFAVRTMSFVPRYGEHQVALGFQPTGLPDLKLPAQHLRGVALAARGPRFTGTVVAGRLDTPRALNALALPFPQVLAMSGSLTPRRGMTLAPRLVAPLLPRREGDRIEPALGVGIRAELARNFTLTSDLGSARARGRWAPSALGSLAGQWSRASFEVASAHVAPDVTLFGPVPFAASRRHLTNVRVELARGVTAEGRISTVSRLTADRNWKTDRGLALHIDRLHVGTLELTLGGTHAASRRSEDVALQWRERGGRGIAVQYEQKRDRLRPADPIGRRIQFELPNIDGWGDLALTLRSSILLSAGSSRDSRSATQLSVRVKAGPFGVSEEMWVDALGATSVMRLRRLVSRVEVPLYAGTGVQIGHEFVAGTRISPWRRLQIGVTHTIGRNEARR